MSRPMTPASSEAPARRFGREIVSAIASGVAAEELTLRLTLMDASKVKRDPSVALSDISFSPEGMRYLGVRVIEGGVRSSELVTGHVEPEPVEAPAPKTRKKAAAKPKAATKAKSAAAAADAAGSDA